MEYEVLLKGMIQLRNQAINDIQQLETIIVHVNRARDFFIQQTSDSEEFIELADLTTLNIRQLCEAMRNSQETLEGIKRTVIKLEMGLPLVPPFF